MTNNKTIVSNIISILSYYGLSMEWLEERTGINSILIESYKYMDYGFSTHILLMIAAALNESIGNILRHHSIVGNSKSIANKTKDEIIAAAKHMYKRFWDNVRDIACTKDLTVDDIAKVTGLSNYGIFICSVLCKDMPIQRIEELADYMDVSIDSLFSEQYKPSPVANLPVLEGIKLAV